MSLLQAFVLGVVQGIGEFLPISSSGHLVVVPYIFGWDYQGLGFDVALHMGTVLAILAYFWRDWMIIFSEALSPTDTPNRKDNFKYPSNLLWIILISSIPAAIAGYFLQDLAEHALRNPLLVATMLLSFGLLLWIVDAAYKNQDKIEKIGYGKGFLVGISQAVALFPGVSRSGVTATTGIFLGLSRESAMRFSFLLSTPAVVGAFILTLKDLSAASIDVAFLVAVATSAVVGFLSIKYLLKFLANHSFTPFVIYRILLAVLIFLLYLIK
ncbi:MAG: Undecaprenyl-diphosphatase [bacterium ADurb.BinA186]|jgi:undecaprenyl-diphosphatase|nr:MAG: Undecaprenyl-diphosphatase [bacterium ADurb.BinA186]